MKSFTFEGRILPFHRFISPNQTRIMNKEISLIALGFGSLPGILSAALDSTPITNGNFEADLGSTVGSGIANFTQSASGWFEKNGTTRGDALQWQVPGNTDIPTDDNGEVWGLLNISKGSQTPANSNGAFYQSIGTNEDNFDVYVDITVGKRGDLPFAEVELNLYSGNVTGVDGSSLAGLGATLLDTHTITLADFSSGNKVVETISLLGIHLNTGTSGVAGQTLWLEIAAVNPGGIDPDHQALVDDISVSAIPEPSSYALFGGLLALGSIMLRRRRD